MSPTFGLLTRKNHTNIKVGRTSHTISTIPKVMNSTSRISLWRDFLSADSLYLISPWNISTTDQSVLYQDVLNTVTISWHYLHSYYCSLQYPYQNVMCIWTASERQLQKISRLCSHYYTCICLQLDIIFSMHYKFIKFEQTMALAWILDLNWTLWISFNWELTPACIHVQQTQGSVWSHFQTPWVGFYHIFSKPFLVFGSVMKHYLLYFIYYKSTCNLQVGSCLQCIKN